MSVLTEKWAKVLDREDCPKLADFTRRGVTAQLIENTIESMNQAKKHGTYVSLVEDAVVPTNVSGGLAAGQGSYTDAAGAVVDPANQHMMGYDPVIINLVRRAVPQMMAFDLCGVQPMKMPTGLVFALRAKYNDPAGKEALYQEADSAFSGHGEHVGSNWADAVEGASDTWGDALDPETGAFKSGYAMPTAAAEVLGSDKGDHAMHEMAFEITRSSVTAQSRALKAEYSMELAQDLKAVHGLDAQTELANILTTEVLADINREIIRDLYVVAKPGAQTGCAVKGVFDLDIDSDGRWSAEKYKSLFMRIEREANAIAKDTRRGRGNYIVCSADIASALQQAGVLDYAPALNNNLNVDEANNTFAGVLNGKYKVFLDPYVANDADNQFFMVGYKGSTAFDAGMFYCPYVPLQLVSAQDPLTFQPRIGFRTRYGLIFNPMVTFGPHDEPRYSNDVKGLVNKNYFYRKVKVVNL